MTNETLALRLALDGLLKAYKELSEMSCKDPDLNLFYKQAKSTMVNYHWKENHAPSKFGVPDTSVSYGTNTGVHNPADREDK